MAEMSTDSVRTTLMESYTTENDSVDEYFSPLKISLFSTILVVSVLGLVGNGIVLWFLGFRMKRNKFTVYILNLALADVLFLLCSCAEALIVLSTAMVDSDIEWSKLYAIQEFTYNSGLSFLTAISLERCLSVLYPFWYHFRRPKHQSIVVCVFLWVLSLFMTGTESFFCISVDSNTDQSCALSVLLVSGALTFLIFTPLMVFSSLTLFFKIQRSFQHQHPPKLYVIIIVAVLIFLVFALPFQLLMTLNIHDYDIPEALFYSAQLFSVINSTANPFVYFLVGRQSKQRCQSSIKMALERVFQQEEILRSNQSDTEV